MKALKTVFLLGALTISAGISLAADTEDSTHSIKPDTICILTSEFDSMALDIINGEIWETKYMHMAERYLAVQDAHRFAMAKMSSSLDGCQKELTYQKKNTRYKVAITAISSAAVTSLIWYKSSQ